MIWAIGIAVAALCFWAWGRISYNQGKSDAATELSQMVNEVKDEQVKIAVNRPSRDELIDSLRPGGDF